MLNHLRPDDYQSRLHGTVVCYKKHPVMVSVEGTDRFSLSAIHPASKFQPLTIHPDDPDLDISTSPMGFFDSFYAEPRNGDRVDTAFYIERLPVRKFSQGICGANTSVSGLINGKLQPIGKGGSIYLCEGYENLVLDKYPSLDSIFKRLLKNSVDSVSVSRKIALAKKGGVFSVYYKKDEVAYIQNLSKPLVRVPKEKNSWVISKYLSELNWEID